MTSVDQGFVSTNQKFLGNSLLKKTANRNTTGRKIPFSVLIPTICNKRTTHLNVASHLVTLKEKI